MKYIILFSFSMLLSFKTWAQTSVSLDGTNFVQFPDDPSLTFTPGDSYDFVGTFNYCVDGHIFNQHLCGDADNDGNLDAGYGLEVIAAGNVRFYAQLQPGCDGTTNFIDITSTTAGLNDNNWHSFDVQIITTPTTVEVNLFIDGNLEASSGVTAGSINDSDAPFNFGVYTNALNQYVDLPQGRIGNMTRVNSSGTLRFFTLAGPGPMTYTGAAGATNGTYHTTAEGSTASMVTPAVYFPDNFDFSSIDLGPDLTICLGETLDLFAGSTGAGFYQWAQSSGGLALVDIPGETNNTYSFTPSSAGVYNVEVTAGVYSCETSDMIEITVLPSPNYSFPDFCENDAPYYLIGVLPSGVSSLYFDGDLTGFAPDGGYDPALAGIGTRTFEICYVMDDGVTTCCTEYIVTVYPVPILDNTLNELYCTGDPLIVLGTDNVGSGSFDSDYFTPYYGADPSSPTTGEFSPSTYISESTIGSETVFTFDPTGLTENTYPITYTYGTQNGCEASTTGYITICNPPEFDLIKTSCISISADITPGTGNCGGPYDIDWSGPGILTVGASDITISSPGTYTCTVTNASGCSTTQSIEVICEPVSITISNTTPCLPTNLNAEIEASCEVESFVWTSPSGTTGDELGFYATEAGTYIFTVTDALNCTTTVTYELLEPDFNINFDPIAPISLCDSPDPILITYTSDGDYCVLTSSSAGFDSATETFDPIAAGPGTHLIEAFCYVGNCFDTETIEIEVLDDLFWHQTTNSAYNRDTYNDVITDASGNVYVTGSFMGETSLYDTDDAGINYTISASSTGELTAFIAKYNKCGELVWITQEFGGPDTKSVGTGLAIDETNGYLYVVGNFNQAMMLQEGAGPSVACTGTASTIAPSSGPAGFVARLTLDNGCVDMLDNVDVAAPTKLTSITMDESSLTAANSDVFISGTVKASGGPGINGTSSFVKSYSIPNAAAPVLPVENWQITAGGPAGGSYRLINEIDYDENLGKLWIIGDFKRHLQLSAGGPTYIVSPKPRAFVAGYDILAGGPVHYWSAPASPTSENRRSNGAGISLDEATGQVFITGFYRRNLANPFGLGSTWTNGSSPNAYQFSFQPYAAAVPTLVWSHETDAGSGGSKVAAGTDVSYSNGQAHFVGYYTNDITTTGPGFLPEVGNGLHVFSMSYDQFTGAESNLNGTSNGPGLSFNIPNAIHANDNGYSFIVGTYRGEMDYLDGTPSSGALVATSSTGGTAYNAFVMRVDRTADGAYRSQEVVDDEPETVKEELNTLEIIEKDLEVSVYPNPTNGELKVNVAGFDSESEYKVELRSISGQLIWSENLINAQSDFDLSELENGMYLLSISNKTEHVTKRIVKQ